MRKIKFIFGVHVHQPVGNVESVVEKAIEEGYRPFIELLKDFPKIKTTLHFSGSLLGFIEKRAPDLIDNLRIMLKRGQIELFSGGYHEPILPSIPEEDRLGQIERMTSKIKDLFDYTPKGLWLAERVWEPSLASTLAKSKIEYVALDDTHFKNAGTYEDELNGYFITEDQGYPLKVFPINRRLRNLVPFGDIDKIISYLSERASETSNNMYLLFDDGEKFGIWPGTYDRVYKERWLEQFFKRLEEESDWLGLSTFEEFTGSVPPRGRTYLPNSAYPEMMAWALPSRARTHFERLENELKTSGEYSRYSMFLKTGFWRTFLSKYTEANLMHKKMLHIRSKYEEGMPSEIEEYLYRSQSNDVYWHGFFGGLYLPGLREEAYRNILKMERMIDKYKYENREFTGVEEKDYDLDGFKEIIISNKQYTIGISPARGGRIHEFSLKDKQINLTNNLTRRYEPYHENMKKSHLKEEGGRGAFLAKEKGLDKFLNYDWYERFSLLDHFFGEWNTIDKYSRCRYPEQGDFTNQVYDSEIPDRENGVVRLSREGHVWHGSLWIPIQVQKEIKLDEEGLLVKHTLTNKSTHGIPIRFGSEINFNFGIESGDSKYFYCPVFDRKSLEDKAKIKTTFLGVRDEEKGLAIEFQPDREVEFWLFPVYTVSYSESGYERLYQTSSITPMHKVTIDPMNTYETEIRIRIKNI